MLPACFLSPHSRNLCHLIPVNTPYHSESFSFSLRKHAISSAFTLIELLVVIAIMAVLGGAVVSITGGGSQDIGSAARSFNSLVQTARTTAVSRGETAYLIIHNDESEPRDYRRLMGVVYEDPEASGQFISVTEGRRLTGQTFILTKDTIADPPLDPGGYDQTRLGAAPLTFDLAFPSTASEAWTESGDGWLAYEFLPNGMAASGTANKILALVRAEAMGQDEYIVRNPALSVSVKITTFGGTITGDYVDIE